MGLLDGLLGGEGGGGMMGGMVQKLIMDQISKPGTTKMISDKMGDMYSHLAEQFKCNKSDIGLFVKLENVPVLTKDGEGKDVIKLGDDGQPEKEDKAIIYVYVGGKAEQKIFVDQFLQMMTAEMAASK